MQIAEAMYAKSASPLDRAVWIRLKDFGEISGLQDTAQGCAVKYVMVILTRNRFAIIYSKIQVAAYLTQFRSNFRVLDALPNEINDFYEEVKNKSRPTTQWDACVRYGLMLTKLELALKHSEK